MTTTIAILVFAAIVGMGAYGAARFVQDCIEDDSAPIEDTETEIPDLRPVSDQFPTIKPFEGMGTGMP